MLMKCYYHLHPLTYFNNDFADQRMDDNNQLNIFQMIVGIIEPAKDFVKKKLLAFQHSQVDVKEIKCPFQWMWKTQLGFCVKF